MNTLLSMLNSFWRDNFGFNFDVFTSDFMEDMKETTIPRLREFLQYLIDTDHIEKIGEGDINDYIRYIATTEDPIQTLIDLLK